MLCYLRDSSSRCYNTILPYNTPANGTHPLASAGPVPFPKQSLLSCLVWGCDVWFCGGGGVLVGGLWGFWGGWVGSRVQHERQHVPSVFLGVLSLPPHVGFQLCPLSSKRRDCILLRG